MPDGLSYISDKFRSLSTYQEGFHDEDQMKTMIYKKFGRKTFQTSLLGFGGFELALCHGTPQEQDAIDTVIAAVKSGINYIDTAPFYGQGKSEIVLGKALKHIPRHAYYLATKVGRYGPDTSNLFDFSAARTLKSVEESLSRLGVDSVDILQVHDLEFAPNIDIILSETLPALQKLKDCGKIKYIGITGYPLCQLKEVLERSLVAIDVVLSYCRLTLFDDSLSSYIPYFKSKNVALINAASLGMGLLTNHGPPAWHPSAPALKEVCRNAAQFCQVEGVDISKIALMHSFSHPDIHVHLVGMNNKEVLEKNLSVVKYLLNGFSAHEKDVKDKVMRSFESCPETDWEHKDVEKYWAKMKSLTQK